MEVFRPAYMRLCTATFHGRPQEFSRAKILGNFSRKQHMTSSFPNSRGGVQLPPGCPPKGAHATPYTYSVTSCAMPHGRLRLLSSHINVIMVRIIHPRSATNPCGRVKLDAENRCLVSSQRTFSYTYIRRVFKSMFLCKKND